MSVCFDPAGLYAAHHETLASLARFVQELTAVEPGDLSLVVINDNPDRQVACSANPSLGYRLVVQLVIGMGDEDDERLVRSLRGFTVPVLSGRPRALLRLAEVDDAVAGDTRLRAQAILATGDNLYEDMRRRLQVAFSCRVHNAYASREADIIGVECAHQRGMHLLSGMAVAEIATDENVYPEGDGELVVTNLRNWAMPFIRYRTGDNARLTRGSCPCGFDGETLTSLSGRDSVEFVFGTRRFNPSLLNPVFEKIPVRQFQVLQCVEGTLHVRWVPLPTERSPDETGRRLAAEIRVLTGETAIFVDALDSLSAPGQKVQRYARVDPTPNQWRAHGQTRNPAR